MKLSLPTRFRLVSAVFVISAILFSSFFAGKTYAVAAFPKNGNIPCDKEKDPEYSSDRPYQASPCVDAPITYFCGNKVIIDLGSVSTPYDPATCGTGADAACPVDIHRDQSIVVDLTNVQLPILGNTQLTINSQSPDDQIDDPTKVNNFVAWYLNGTNDKAEYPAVDATTRAGISQVIDTSGPIKKLLPSAILDAQRYDTIITASKTQKPYIQSTFDLQEGSDPQNHNQIVVCTTHNIFGINNPWIGAEKPIPCYEGVNNPAQGKPYRLKDWGEGNLSIFNTFFNFLGAQKWDNKYPPLPWQFTSNLYYQKAYREWKGATCVIVPIFNTLACASIPILSPDRTWSDLYPYIPLANTVDKKGVQQVSGVNVTAPKAVIENKTYEILHSPQLYLAHSLENYSLSNILKTTYVPTKEATINSKGYPGPSIPADVEYNSAECRIIDSRINPGDWATFSKPKSYISVNVHYDVTSIKCTTPVYECDLLGNCGWKSNCRSGVTAEIPSISKTPYADEIWQNTVAGSDSIYRKIYPKNGPDAPVTCLADIPAVSPATYTLDQGSSSPGIGLSEVVEPDGSTSFTGDGVKIAAQLYFPHYGGVLDYFLKGIQTALRPQGFAPPTPLSGQYCEAVKVTCDGVLFGKLKPPNSTTAQAKSFFTSSILPNLTPDLIKVYAQAEQVTGVPCEILAGVHFEEADNSPTGSLQNGGPLSSTLLASAIQAGNEIKAKVGGTIDTWDKAITALSRYNGGGNSNCGVAPGYTGPCPPPEGIDDIYPMAWMDAAHINMYLIYCWDGIKCPLPFKLVIRPGALTVATEMYLQEPK